MLRYVRAAAEDQARIEQFLGQFVDDYLVHEFPRYLTYKTGGIYLANDDDQLVGLSVIALPKPHEAYLGGMRIRPDVQGKGVGEEFAAFQVAEAERLGATVIRALVPRGNDASRSIWEGLGFRVVEEWVVGTFEGFQGPPYGNEVAGPAWAIDRQRIEAFYEQHPRDLWAMPDPWIPQSLTLDDIWGRLEAGGALVAPQEVGQAVDTLALYAINDRDLTVHYMRSMGTHLKALLEYLWVEARAWGVKTLRFGLPRPQADKLKEAAALPVLNEWRGLILEKQVGLSPQPSI
ncbi:hypothetical protein TPY_0752 [Sulfobacillus acidophilus TPY]|uniref:GCN5-related N-acetyltransferase n=1 Tax=Sulfobacillus acidophilus (strain ATCC 700253 / DSM 10332 / NAL) TaxID=679936 RepID=G8TZ79_SULAD|nr:hypothetical protein TPY_0752 [Sulfobacillus acidophilus TPY]AEW06349.1 GCN5-related N-acetyltransferase [Sulfobacillus acidophilus DSM 10332]